MDGRHLGSPRTSRVLGHYAPYDLRLCDKQLFAITLVIVAAVYACANGRGNYAAVDVCDVPFAAGRALRRRSGVAAPAHLAPAESEIRHIWGFCPVTRRMFTGFSQERRFPAAVSKGLLSRR
jgi:hypothetical protein